MVGVCECCLGVASVSGLAVFGAVFVVFVFRNMCVGGCVTKIKC